MLFKIITTTNARKDIEEAIAWENRKQPDLGLRFLNELDEKFDHLAVTPKMGSVRYENVRLTSTQTFKYNIHYLVSDENSSVYILRVLHRYRKPIY